MLILRSLVYYSICKSLTHQCISACPEGAFSLLCSTMNAAQVRLSSISFTDLVVSLLSHFADSYWMSLDVEAN